MIPTLVTLLASKRVMAFTPDAVRFASSSVRPEVSGLRAKSLFQEIDEFFDDVMRPASDLFDRKFGLLPSSRDRFLPLPMQLLQGTGWKDMELRRSSPRFDIVEGEKEFKVAMEVPGLSLDDVKVEFNDGSNTLRMTGGRKVKEGDETYESHFEKHFRIGNYIDADKIEANLENGILVVSLPKDEKFMDVRTIPIKAGKSEQIHVLEGSKSSKQKVEESKRTETVGA